MGTSGPPLEYVFLILLLICMSTFVLLTQIDIPDTDSIVPFENTTPINQHKMMRTVEYRADFSDKSEWYFRTVGYHVVDVR